MLPRLAVFSTWGSTQDVGWVRYAFDHFEVPYDLIYKERINKGTCARAYDVIVIPNQGRGSAKGWCSTSSRKRQAARLYEIALSSRRSGCMANRTTSPAAWASQAWSSSTSSSKQGGVLITLGAASFLPADFGITRTVDAHAHPRRNSMRPDRLCEAEIMRPDASHFLRLYAKDHAGALGRAVRCCTCRGPDRRTEVLMRFPGGDKSVLSGLMKGAAEIRDRPAIVDVPVGPGPRSDVRDQPLLSLAEPGRVQHAGQRHFAFQ